MPGPGEAISVVAICSIRLGIQNPQQDLADNLMSASENPLIRGFLLQRRIRKSTLEAAKPAESKVYVYQHIQTRFHGKVRQRHTVELRKDKGKYVVQPSPLYLRHRAMDENFNSLAEEQKEGGVVYNAKVLKEGTQSAIDMDDNSVSAPSEGASSLEPLTPPAAASERKKSPENENQAYPGYLWSGELPPRNYSNPTFSSKIFVGGVPWDITETALIDAFSPYGNCRVEWPCKEVRSSRSNKTRGKITGYVYMVFETERSVRLLLQDCSQEFGSAGEWYFKLKARRNQSSEIRQVQVIPWVVSDSCYNDDPSYPLDPKKTVFVGALHGMLTAHVLFSIMNELYGNVVFVGIDTDKYKYPIGSGRVTFRSHASYFRAIESAFLEIRTSKFSKRVQIDPFLEDSWCMVCGEAQGVPCLRSDSEFSCVYDTLNKEMNDISGKPYFPSSDVG
ncbi:unnamed protein product [Cylicocyclus nassatus]|uniref:RRM domain-containing protein n=1 Tax=Cylicocyclus nassatus TaxID=53992 RepID=A0AA36GK32_CYLNA|nr:unnamed protein product [Cylicocyclus nassatus]